MGKRKVNRRQRWRIEKIQQERTERMRRRAEQDEALLESGDLGPEQKGLVITHYGSQLDVEALDGDDQGTVIRCRLRTHLDHLVTGDEVVWRRVDEHHGVVVATLPRRSELSRPDRKGDMRPVAANIDHIIIVVAPKPEPSSLLMDRYLVAAELTNIKPTLLFNKFDLFADDPNHACQTLMARYEKLGYHVITSSTKTDHGMDALHQMLAGSVSVFVGQSGVGKSSLINQLLPEQDLRVGNLSEATGLGTHTTTSATLYHLPQGGDLIDSAGVREFALWHIDEDMLVQGFREFRALLGACKFRNCRHENEPKCAIRDAVAAGEIDSERFENFLKIRETLRQD